MTADKGATRCPVRLTTDNMDTPFLSAAFQVVVGGVLVFLAGILIGSS
jgi:hypothetical protein